MARIISALLHRPHLDKSKRVLRIPVGGHTEKTLLRGQTAEVVMLDEVNFLPEPLVPEVEAPRIGDELIVNDLFAIVAQQQAEEAVVAEVSVAPEVGLAEAVEEDDDTEEEVVDGEPTEDPPFIVEIEEEEEAAEEEKPKKAKDGEPEDHSSQKFDYVDFLSQKPGEIKAALATGEHDHHLAALIEFETAGSARKTVLARIAERVKA